MSAVRGPAGPTSGAGGDRPVAVIVDAYSAGKFLPAACQRQGADVVHLQSTPEFLSSVPPPDLRPYLANVVHASGDWRDTAAALAAYAPVAVLAGQESAVPAADTVAGLLGLPGNPAGTSALRRDKFRMIDALRAAGLHCARQLRSADPEEVVSWAGREAGYPVVVKPLSSASTDGVSICRDPAEVRAAVAAVLGSTDIFGRRNTEILAQSFLAGDEYVVDVVRGAGGERHVCGIWRYEKAMIGAKRVYDRDLLIDPGSPEVAELVPYLDAVLDALDIRFGAAHAEIMLTPAGPALVEVGARVNGLIDPGFHDLCLDGNQADLLAMAAVRPQEFRRRNAAEARYRKRREAMVVHGRTSRAGIVARIDEEALARIAALDTVRLVVPRLAVGDRMRPTTDLLSSPLRVFLAADRPQDLIADHRRIQQLTDDVFQLAPAPVAGGTDLVAGGSRR
ncbi:ATP-grasp domain-containing protein [Micromonospora sp. PLK6-60]|uniref:ATP-grasp domain-containing protein n=1 Tax=Micromonospora sp. PLK6-60 TaxID=2873383 RepID=UPI001CA6210A|nr:ATP-grasp domain-containing protein [Micromonospora sp. PLK6-60]MBY8875057.1 ATP-grasp domain-containing protein [Micromonospora sp. PLK6-60]